VKLLVSAGTIMGGVFLTIGQYLGGLAATLVQFVTGNWAAAWETAKNTVFDFAGNVRSAAGTVSTIWDSTAGSIASKAPQLGGKLAAPLVTAAERARSAGRARGRRSGAAIRYPGIRITAL
jgi:hypothetical protein